MSESTDRGQIADPIMAALRRARQAAGLSQTEIAAIIGTSQSAVSEAEIGVTQPGIGLVHRYAEAVNVELRLAAAAADPVSAGAMRRELRRLWEEAGRPSVRRVAHMCDGVSHTTVAGILNGTIETPGWAKTASLTRALSGDVDTMRTLWLREVGDRKLADVSTSEKKPQVPVGDRKATALEAIADAIRDVAAAIREQNR